MSVGIGGAGSKLSAQLSADNVIVNVSEAELNKVPAAEKLLAVLHSERGQRRGCRKNPSLGRESFASIRTRIMDLVRGNLVFASAGGGTGNGICSMILSEIAAQPAIAEEERTRFALLMPSPEHEPAEYVRNSIEFLTGPLSAAMDSGNAGNIFLLSNREKFRRRMPEHDFNEAVVASLRNFLEIPRRGEELELLEGHIDYEDFDLYLAKPYFNHFTAFEFDANEPFAAALQRAANPYLLPADTAIEALFFLELPPDADRGLFYPILDALAGQRLAPVYSVAINPRRSRPFISVSQLYGRKPDLLVKDLQAAALGHQQERIRKSLEQQVVLTTPDVDLEEEARIEAKKAGKSEDDILSVLRRLGKLR